MRHIVSLDLVSALRSSHHRANYRFLIDVPPPASGPVAEQAGCLRTGVPVGGRGRRMMCTAASTACRALRSAGRSGKSLILRLTLRGTTRPRLELTKRAVWSESAAEPRFPLLAEPLGIALDFHSGGVVQQPVEDHTRDHGVAKDLTPCLETLLAGQQASPCAASAREHGAVVRTALCP